jgi:hypothetical protein
MVNKRSQFIRKEITNMLLGGVIGLFEQSVMGMTLWKDIVLTLRMSGNDDVISLEHEDGMISFDEGVKKGLAALDEAVTV